MLFNNLSFAIFLPFVFGLCGLTVVAFCRRV